MDDVRAVMDAVSWERAAVFGYSEGGPLSILFAAARPERVSELVLYGAYAKRLRSEDYPWAPTEEERLAYGQEVEREWAFGADMRRMCPSADEAMARWWESRARAAASPGAARALIEMNSRIDVRDVLPAVRVATLVLHRTGDLDSRVDEGRTSRGASPKRGSSSLPALTIAHGSMRTRSSTRSSSSSPASGARRRHTACWPRS
jgi:pimeloyl-ACP methyl ester carboxylesterase